MKDKFMPRNILSSPYLEVVPSKKTAKVIIVGAVGVNEALNESIIVKCHGVKIKICGSNIKMNVILYRRKNVQERQTYHEKSLLFIQSINQRTG